ncbi:MAG: hypothetical protein IKO47_09570 [Ruminococcus sp.]|nr:hypothetical protein [Ruminococcus sp.]
MFNYIVLWFLAALFTVSVITVLAEFVTARNSGAGRFFRAIRIRLRELSIVRVCVTSIMLLLFGLAIGDDTFSGIWAAIALLFGTLAVLHPEELMYYDKHRKKAKLKKGLLPLTPVLAENPGTPLRELPETPLLHELAPMETEPEEDCGEEQKGR